jgi:hypothetical protein
MGTVGRKAVVWRGASCSLAQEGNRIVRKKTALSRAAICFPHVWSQWSPFLQCANITEAIHQLRLFNPEDRGNMLFWISLPTYKTTWWQYQKTTIWTVSNENIKNYIRKLTCNFKDGYHYHVLYKICNYFIFHMTSCYGSSGMTKYNSKNRLWRAIVTFNSSAQFDVSVVRAFKSLAAVRCHCFV